jgi:hypothetical protein
MSALSIQFLIIRPLVATFALFGLVQLAGPRFVREAYARWEYPRGYYYLTGMLELLAATLLALPGTRILGAILAGSILFGAIITLLENHEYLHALPAIVLLVGTILAAALIAGAKQ